MEYSPCFGAALSRASNSRWRVPSDLVRCSRTSYGHHSASCLEQLKTRTWLVMCWLADTGSRQIGWKPEKLSHARVLPFRSPSSCWNVGPLVRVHLETSSKVVPSGKLEKRSQDTRRSISGSTIFELSTSQYISRSSEGKSYPQNRALSIIRQEFSCYHRTISV